MTLNQGRFIFVCRCSKPTFIKNVNIVDTPPKHKNNLNLETVHVHTSFQFTKL